MDIFDREWCNLFVWTVNGSSVFHIKRDREYWCVCFQALAEFWWSHVVPAKHALLISSGSASIQSKTPYCVFGLPQTIMFLVLVGWQCTLAVLPSEHAACQPHVKTLMSSL